MVRRFGVSVSGQPEDWGNRGFVVSGFSHIHERALDLKGGADALEELIGAFGTPVSDTELAKTSDDRWLSMMTRCVFRAGFVWRVIDNKWDGFEEAFHAFDVGRVAFLDDDEIDTLAQDTRIIRNPQKIRATRENALFMVDIRKEHGSFAKFIADWPIQDITGLWDLLKKRGSRLGGRTGPMVLREMGKDTFMLSPDVVKTLIDEGVVDKDPTSKKALAAVQEAFNAWHAETGMPLARLSRICALSQG